MLQRCVTQWELHAFLSLVIYCCDTKVIKRKLHCSIVCEVQLSCYASVNLLVSQSLQATDSNWRTSIYKWRYSLNYKPDLWNQIFPFVVHHCPWRISNRDSIWRSIGFSPVFLFSKTNWWSSVTSPITYMGARSLSATDLSSLIFIFQQGHAFLRFIPNNLFCRSVGSPIGRVSI